MFYAAFFGIAIALTTTAYREPHPDPVVNGLLWCVGGVCFLLAIQALQQSVQRRETERRAAEKAA